MKYKWTVEIEVSDVWVADGFNLTEKRLKAMVLNDLDYAHENEVRCKILHAPSEEDIRVEQGYQIGKGADALKL